MSRDVQKSSPEPKSVRGPKWPRFGDFTPSEEKLSESARRNLLSNQIKTFEKNLKNSNKRSHKKLWKEYVSKYDKSTDKEKARFWCQKKNTVNDLRMSKCSTGALLAYWPDPHKVGNPRRRKRFRGGSGKWLDLNKEELCTVLIDRGCPATDLLDSRKKKRPMEANNPYSRKYLKQNRGFRKKSRPHQQLGEVFSTPLEGPKMIREASPVSPQPKRLSPVSPQQQRQIFESDKEEILSMFGDLSPLDFGSQTRDDRQYPLDFESLSPFFLD